MSENLTLEVEHGGGAYGTIPNPQSYANGGVVWRLTYGNYEQARWPATSIIDTFSALISPEINMKEATRRLAQFRRSYRAALKTGGDHAE